MRNVLEYLEATAAQYPEKLSFSDEKTAMTFSQLLTRSKCLGTVIARKVQCTNRPVGVLVQRAAQTPMAFMAVLQSGNCYVPLDAQMPKARLETILQQLSPALIVYGKEDEAVAQTLRAQYDLLCIEENADGTIDEALLAARRSCVLDTDPVYIIFTSGSTGVPKGIACHHRGVIDLADWLAETAGYTSEDVLGNQAPFYFDGSVKDLYMCIKCAVTCHILPKKLFMFPKLLVQYLTDHGVTALQWATSAFHLVAASHVLEQYIPGTVRKLLLGGEALLARDVNIWRRALPDADYFNLYGPTEATVDALFYHLDRAFADSEPIPIGSACANKEVFLLDEARKPVAQGQPGEICIRGTGLALGYYNDPEKTAAAFIQNPLQTMYPERIYCTGDIAVQNEQGLFVFQARQDGQIKHMGYRIELGEIERALAAMPELQESACFFDSEKDWIVCVFSGTAEKGEILRFARTLLPKYMLPNVLIPMDRLPHNANGKIDRPKLKKDYFDGQNQ